MANPIVLHSEAMLSQLDPEPLRAAYMVIQQLYTLQKAKEKVNGAKIVQ